MSAAFGLTTAEKSDRRWREGERLRNYTTADLRDFAKQCGVKSSGRRDELIGRLIDDYLPW